MKHFKKTSLYCLFPQREMELIKERSVKSVREKKRKSD